MARFHAFNNKEVDLLHCVCDSEMTEEKLVKRWHYQIIVVPALWIEFQQQRIVPKECCRHTNDSTVCYNRLLLELHSLYFVVCFIYFLQANHLLFQKSTSFNGIYREVQMGRNYF